MSKLEIAGPRELLLTVLEIIREAGTFQPEAFSPAGTALPASDDRIVSQRLFLDNLRRQSTEIIALLPPLESRESWLDPQTLLDTIAVTAPRHLTTCRQLAEADAAHRREEEELQGYGILLAAIDRLLGDRDPHPGLEFIGVTLRDPALVERLRELLTDLVAGEYTLTTTVAADNTLIGLIAVPARHSPILRRALSDEQLPELPVPEACSNLTLAERIRYLEERLATVHGSRVRIAAEQECFARRWLAYYRRINQWLIERLALLTITASVRQTGTCFVIHGWALSEERAALEGQLNQAFAGRVAVEERELLEQDLEQVPVALKNPPYLRPFEILTRLLPLPRYSSWDPTPFIGIFFPLFFGIMLGDAGHGLVLLAASLLLRRHRPHGTLGDAARILSICASYAILFGLLFGEFFGAAGAHLLHLTPVLPERSRAIMPLLLFSLALGAAHVLLGLLLGLTTAIQRRRHREVLVRVMTIALLACLAYLTAGMLVPSPWLRTRPILLLTGFLLPLLILSGGLLAPLEMLKTFGNIVSYARIMAIGLSSALLANAANHLAGLSGDLVIGTLAAILLHAVAIVLGVFAPAIHALRLHFVEFFSKFIEPGGRRFQPLHK